MSLQAHPYNICVYMYICVYNTEREREITERERESLHMHSTCYTKVHMPYRIAHASTFLRPQGGRCSRACRACGSSRCRQRERERREEKRKREREREREMGGEGRGEERRGGRGEERWEGRGGRGERREVGDGCVMGYKEKGI